MVNFRNLVILASSLAFVAANNAKTDNGKTDSELCNSITEESATSDGWKFLTNLRSTVGKDSRLQIATGHDDFCQFEVTYGKNPWGNFDQLRQQVTCKSMDNLEYKVVYVKGTTVYKSFALPWLGKQPTPLEAKCSNYGGDFQMDASRIDSASVYYKEIGALGK